MDIETNENEYTLEKKLKKEYESWKDNSFLLYDQISSHILEWPTLTVDVLPSNVYTYPVPTLEPEDEEENEDDVIYQYVVIGTHTSQDEPNFLKLLRVTLPKVCGSTTKEFKTYKDYNGFEYGNPKANKFQTCSQIYHPMEINRARASPVNPHLIATKAVSGDVLIYSMKGGENLTEKVDHSLMHLKGHTKEGFGLNWSGLHKGYLASSANDGCVCVWDVNARIDGKDMNPLHQINAHTQPANDVGWSEQTHNTIFSCGDDGHIKMWDIRQRYQNPASSPNQTKNMKGSIDCLAVFPQNDYVVASSCDQMIHMWDVRQFTNFVHSINAHEQKINSLSFSPLHNGLLLSGSEDRFISLWDINRIGMEQDEEDEEDGPPELFFTHAGHSKSVSDVSWVHSSPFPSYEYMVVSASEDNVIQIWSPIKFIVEEKGDENLSVDNSDEDDVDSDVE